MEQSRSEFTQGSSSGDQTNDDEKRDELLLNAGENISAIVPEVRKKMKISKNLHLVLSDEGPNKL